MSDFKETDLYEPVKKLFEGMGFSVYSEVKGCDLMAVKEEKTIIAELKKSFNITLVYQLLDRQSFCKNVYAVIPRPKKGARDRNFKSMVKLCKRLDLGLITVAVESPMKITEIICSPEEVNKITNYAKKKKVQKEVLLRSGDYNKGGSTGKKLMTAYREKSIELMCIIEKIGKVTMKSLSQMGYDKSTCSIIYRNYYHWFERESKGVYILSAEGKRALESDEYAEVVEFYRNTNLYKTLGRCPNTPQAFEKA